VTIPKGKTILAKIVDSLLIMYLALDCKKKATNSRIIIFVNPWLYKVDLNIRS
jgi:hypothetical protein